MSAEPTGNPIDAQYCPSCGEELPEDTVEFWDDELLNRYRAPFTCPSCDYRGEIIRHSG